MAALQSTAGRSLLQSCGRRPDDISSIVVVRKITVKLNKFRPKYIPKKEHDGVFPLQRTFYNKWQ
jgi:hypothetical protein